MFSRRAPRLFARRLRPNRPLRRRSAPIFALTQRAASRDDETTHQRHRFARITVSTRARNFFFFARFQPAEPNCRRRLTIPLSCCETSRRARVHALKRRIQPHHRRVGALERRVVVHLPRRARIERRESNRNDASPSAVGLGLVKPVSGRASLRRAKRSIRGRAIATCPSRRATRGRRHLSRSDRGLPASREFHRARRRRPSSWSPRTRPRIIVAPPIARDRRARAHRAAMRRSSSMDRMSSDYAERIGPAIP